METSLRKMGNSAGVILPQAAIGGMGLTAGTRFDISVEGDRIVLTAKRHGGRAGWADDAAAISTAPDAERDEWLAMPNESDQDLAW